MFKFLHHHAFRYLTLNFENENAKFWTLTESWAKMETKNKQLLHNRSEGNSLKLSSTDSFFLIESKIQAVASH